MGHRIFGLDVVEDMPKTEFVSMVFTRCDGKGFIAYDATPSGSSARHSTTREGAEEELKETRIFHQNFWKAKLAYRNSGDRTEDGTHVIRIGGKHFMAKPGIDLKGRDFKGFGGRKFVWREFATGEVFESNDVWHQGTIPPEYRDQLPDNAEWIENTSAVQ